MTNPEISSAEAKPDKLFYVVANIIIVNTMEWEASCLLLKRSENEKVLPGKWGFPGGKLEHKDVAKLLAETGKEPIEGIDNILGQLAIREAKEECGLEVRAEDSVIKNKVFVRPDGIPVFMAVVTAEYDGHGEIKLEDEAFSDYAWVTEADIRNYDCIKGVPDEAAKAIKAYPPR